MLTDSRGATFCGCVQDVFGANSCVHLCSCEPTHGAPACERDVCLRVGEPVTQECVTVPASHSAPKLQQINIPLLLCQC